MAVNSKKKRSPGPAKKATRRKAAAPTTRGRAERAKHEALKQNPPALARELGINPKDLLGSAKVPLSAFPAIAVAHGAHAMVDGRLKYGPWNWRQNAVRADVYVDAAKRHIDNWFERQDDAKDSNVNHLGHALACIGIILDAEATGNLVDNRPFSAENGWLDKKFDQINAKIKERMDRNG